MSMFRSLLASLVAYSKRGSMVNVLILVDPKPECSVVRVGRALVQTGVAYSIFSRISCATWSPVCTWKGVVSLFHKTTKTSFL
jgi:hypothetical protein